MIKKLLIFAAICVVYTFTAKMTLAADASYGILNVADYLNVLRNYDHLDVGSRIYDNGQLHLATDDYLFLDASQKVYFQNEAYFTRNYDGWQGSGSRIYDNGQLHLATDDFLYLDAPNTVYIQNNLEVHNGLYFHDGAVADFSNAEVIGLEPLSDLSDEVDNKVSKDGDTMTGQLDADGGIDVNGGLFHIYTDGSSYIGGEMVLNGNAPLKVNSTSFLYGGINIPAGGFVVNPEGGIYTAGVVDFSGAASFRLPNIATADRETCDQNGKGKMYFDTDTNSFWGCDGTNWREFATNPLN